MANITDLAGMIDHTLLQPTATADNIRQLCREAKEYGFRSVCVNPCYVKLAAEELEGTPVKVCSVIGFPLGASSTEAKVFEAWQALRDGAREIDMVLNLGYLKSGRVSLVQADIQAVVDMVHGGAVLKVILETCLLTQEEKELACRAAKAAGADFVKTSTGFSTGGATVEDVKLMRETVGPDMGVKASGGIRDLAKALAMVEAGANRLGCSAGVAIMEEWKKQTAEAAQN